MTVEQFDFSVQPELRRTLLASCFSSESVARGRNLILAGRSGRCQTHVAIAIAYKAIENGFGARFATPTISNRPEFLERTQPMGDEALRTDFGRISWGLSDACTAPANGAAPAYLDRQ